MRNKGTRPPIRRNVIVRGYTGRASFRDSSFNEDEEQPVTARMPARRFHGAFGLDLP